MWRTTDSRRGVSMANPYIQQSMPRLQGTWITKDPHICD